MDCTLVEICSTSCWLNRRINIVLVTSCKVFKNPKNSRDKWGKIVFALMVSWLGKIYIINYLKLYKYKKDAHPLGNILGGY